MKCAYAKQYTGQLYECKAKGGKEQTCPSYLNYGQHPFCTVNLVGKDYIKKKNGQSN